MSTYKPRRAKCTECSNGMIKRCGTQKYCASCKRIMKERATYEYKVRTGVIKNPGTGSVGVKGCRAKCHEFGNGMIKKANNQKYCASCRKKVDTRIKFESAVRTGGVKNPGVGTGALQDKERNSNWIGGARDWQVENFRGTECKRCGSGGDMHLHHQDRDVSNWKDGNVETLCVPCHRKEHGNDKGERYYES